jgi:hypothetical protein
MWVSSHLGVFVVGLVDLDFDLNCDLNFDLLVLSMSIDRELHWVGVSAVGALLITLSPRSS